MNSGLTELEKRTLLYLNFRGEASEEQLTMVRKAIDEVKSVARPVFTVKYYKIDECPIYLFFDSLQTMFGEALPDLEAIAALPGHKVVVEGNHDYWWGTTAKMQKQFAEHGYDTVRVLRNSAFVSEEAVITGTRLWKRLEDDGVKAEDIKIHNREVERTRLCLQSLKDADPEHRLPHIMMFHYPPLGRNGERTDVSGLIEESGLVDICLYGHLHGRAHSQIKEGEIGGVKYFCVAADYLKFKPLRVL